MARWSRLIGRQIRARFIESSMKFAAQNPMSVQASRISWVLCAFAERDTAGLENAFARSAATRGATMLPFLSVPLGEALLARMQRRRRKDTRSVHARARGAGKKWCRRTRTLHLRSVSSD